MNTLRIEAKLAEKYKYKKLPDDLSEKYRTFWAENIPDYLEVNGDNKELYTIEGTIICKKYDRIVIGDYGAFIEFSKEDIVKRLSIAPGQEYRIYNKQFRDRVKYHWLTIGDHSDTKIYEQVREVTYADYKPNKYYVSVHEAFTLDGLKSLQKAPPCQVGDILFAYDYCLDWSLDTYKVVSVTQHEDYSCDITLRSNGMERIVSDKEIGGEKGKYQFDRKKCVKIDD